MPGKTFVRPAHRFQHAGQLLGCRQQLPLTSRGVTVQAQNVIIAIYGAGLFMFFMIALIQMAVQPSFDTIKTIW